MKFKYLLLSLLAAGSLTTIAQNANVFASGLTLNSIDGTKVNISYTLNVDATSVTLKIGGKEFALGAGQRGVNTVEVNLDGVSGENLPWSIVAAGEAITTPVKIDDKTTCDNMEFYHARSIAVDNNLESPFFGRVYVAESGHSTTSRTSNGLYVFNSAFEDITEQGDVPYGGNAGFENQASASPQRVFVAKDALYLCDWSDSHGGVWKANPADLNADFQPVFEGTRNDDGLISNADGVPVAGSIVSIWVEGSGDNTVLYTFDEDYRVNEAKFPILQYNIGSLLNPWSQAPSAVVFDNANGLAVNGSTTIIPDATGWWISQYRWLENADQPALIHYNTATKTEDYNTATADPNGVQVGNSQIGGLAINEEGTLLAIANNDAIKVFDLGETAEGAPLLTLKYTIPHGLATNRVWGLAFDVAGNLYVANDQSAGVASFALPYEANEFETPCHTGQYITIGGGGIKGDIDGSGNIDVADVNKLINMILGKEEPNAAANVDGEGAIDVNDLNTLINIVLGK